MNHIVFFDGENWALTSVIATVDGLALEDQNIVKQLIGKGLVIAVGNLGVVPLMTNQDISQIIANSSEDIIRLLDKKDTIYLVSQDYQVYQVTFDVSGNFWLISVRNVYGV